MSRLIKAMQKAKRAREVGRGDFTGDGDPLSAAPSRPVHKTEPVREWRKPTYHRTKVKGLEPRILRRHKIVSLFHEEEMTDQLKILRTQVLNKMEEIGGNSLLITSVRPLEGKTTTAINLAVSISHKLDHTILLVDADLRKPMIHRFFGFEAQQGLSDYLLGQAEIPDLMLNPGIDKLVLLPGGTPLPNSTELLGSPRMEYLVKDMKGRYSDRFIIFDSSSLSTSADPLVFSRFIDGILLVVEAERNSTKDLDGALEQLKDRNIIGTVFNKVKEV